VYFLFILYVEREVYKMVEPSNKCSGAGIGTEPVENYRDLMLYLKKKFDQTPNTLRLNCTAIFLSTSLDLSLLLMMAKCPCTIPLQSSYSTTVFNISKGARNEYAKHIKRSYILDMWSVAESYIQETCKGLGLDKKGHFGFMKSSIKNVIDILEKDGYYNDETEVMITLKRVFGKCPKEADVMTKLRGLLSEISNVDIDYDEIITFFELFKEWRNAMHNNFIPSKFFKSKVKWFPDIIAEQAIEIKTDHLVKMTDILVDFCQKVDEKYKKIVQRS